MSAAFGAACVWVKLLAVGAGGSAPPRGSRGVSVDVGPGGPFFGTSVPALGVRGGAVPLLERPCGASRFPHPLAELWLKPL